MAQSKNAKRVKQLARLAAKRLDKAVGYDNGTLLEQEFLFRFTDRELDDELEEYFAAPIRLIDAAKTVLQEALEMLNGMAGIKS